MPSIPFSLPDMDAGLQEVKGLVHLDDEFLVLEIETAFLGEFGKDRVTVKVEPKALKEVWVEPGVFRDQLCIRPKKRDLLHAVPGDHLGELRLKVWKKHHDQIRRLVDEVRDRMRGTS